jgi:hypothetical protein
VKQQWALLEPKGETAKESKSDKERNDEDDTNRTRKRDRRHTSGALGSCWKK